MRELRSIAVGDDDSMKKSKMLRRLDEASTSGRVVTVERDGLDERAQALVLSRNDDWVAVQDLSEGVHLDSVVLMRIRDISSVREDRTGYYNRAIAALGEPKATFSIADDATARDLLVQASELHPLSAFAIGDEGDEALMIGRLLKAGKRKVRLRFIDTCGTWDDDVDTWTYGQISSITIGGRYIDGLARFGDPYPDDSRGMRAAEASP